MRTLKLGPSFHLAGYITTTIVYYLLISIGLLSPFHSLNLLWLGRCNQEFAFEAMTLNCVTELDSEFRL